jgi:fucose 4-O-acetylase-like acetyltransferase
MSTISVDIPVLQPVDEERASAAIPQASSVAQSRRNPTLDAARVLAAMGLVWIHTTQSSLSRFHILGRFGTSFFILAAIFFIFHPLGSSPRLSYGAYALKRFRRLYIPFAAWSLIYLLARDLKRILIHEPAVTLHWSRLFAGTSMQFWFLPFIFIACLICFPLPPLFERMGRGKYLLVPFIVAAGLWLTFTNRPGVEGADDVTNYFLDSSWTFAPLIHCNTNVVSYFKKWNNS